MRTRRLRSTEWTAAVAIVVALPAHGDSAAIDAGVEALSRLRLADAIRILERAREEGPYPHSEYVRLHEQLGIAYAYAGQRRRAIEVFDVMLALEPAHALPYTLSPKATLVFEAARRQATRRPAPALDVAWSRAQKIDRPVPIDVDVVADPHRFLAWATVFHRVQGEPAYRAARLPLDDPTGRHRVVLDAPVPAATGPGVLELYVVAQDPAGNEVLVWGSPQRPREITLDYDPPVAWYNRWWVWAAVGTAVAAGTSGLVYLSTRSEPATIDGTAGFR